MELTIKDTFNLNNNVESTPIEEKDSKTKRMNQLVASYDKKNEIIKEETEPVKEISKEGVERLNKLSKHRLISEYGNDSINQTGMVYGGSLGQTINNFTPNQTFVKKFADISKTSLNDAEALDVSIKRALKSGAPINNMSFYDEVNYHLNELGFASKMPLDIKGAIMQLVQFGIIDKNKVS
jgi:hypothetical protein